LNKNLLLITRTAVLLALLIVWQYATSFMQNQIITGSGVNLILALAAVLSGLHSGLAIACLSPVIAFLLGIGPKYLPLIPFIAAGNAVFAAIWYFVGTKTKLPKLAGHIVSTVAAAAAKFAVLYMGIVKIALPVLLVSVLKPPQMDAMSAMFALPQLITALIGGAVATAALPSIRAARPRRAGV
jgi:hypothetical protein